MGKVINSKEATEKFMENMQNKRRLFECFPDSALISISMPFDAWVYAKFAIAHVAEEDESWKDYSYRLMAIAKGIQTLSEEELDKRIREHYKNESASYKALRDQLSMQYIREIGKKVNEGKRYDEAFREVSKTFTENELKLIIEDLGYKSDTILKEEKSDN